MAAVTGGLLQASYCQSADVTLFIQQTPAQGGTIIPSAGIHHFAPNSQVALTAVPQPAYQFIYWLGDVSDPTASSTTVFLDGPKVVLAVFEPLEPQYYVQGRSGRGGGGTIAAVADFGQHGWMEAHSRTIIEQSSPSTPQAPAADVPEPATLMLLSLGAIIFGRRIRASRRTSQ